MPIQASLYYTHTFVPSFKIKISLFPLVSGTYMVVSGKLVLESDPEAPSCKACGPSFRALSRPKVILLFFGNSCFGNIFGSAQGTMWGTRNWTEPDSVICKASTLHAVLSLQSSTPQMFLKTCS